VLVAQPLTGDRSAIRTALGQLRATGATALYDAAYLVLQLRHPDLTRGVAVVLTDGADNASWLTADRVLQAARRSDLVLYGIGVNEAPRVPRTRGEPIRHPAPAAMPAAFGDLPQYRFLRDLAGVGAGTVFDASYATLRETFARILTEVRARYLLAYHPNDSTPGWHRLEVKLTRGGGDVSARRGYWAGPVSRGPE
jgi:Ca-activated chloride channel family protein